jgi:hypothetical protein
MDSGIEIALISVSISAIVSVSVTFISPWWTPSSGSGRSLKNNSWRWLNALQRS